MPARKPQCSLWTSPSPPSNTALPANPHFHPQPWAATNLLSLPIIRPFLEESYKWNCTICVLLYLASFHSAQCFWASWVFLNVHGDLVFKGMLAESSHKQMNHFSMWLLLPSHLYLVRMVFASWSSPARLALEVPWDSPTPIHVTGLAWLSPCCIFFVVVFFAFSFFFL